jgi:hypothetical protein
VVSAPRRCGSQSASDLDSSLSRPSSSIGVLPYRSNLCNSAGKIQSNNIPGFIPLIFFILLFFCNKKPTPGKYFLVVHATVALYQAAVARGEVFFLAVAIAPLVGYAVDALLHAHSTLALPASKHRESAVGPLQATVASSATARFVFTGFCIL